MGFCLCLAVSEREREREREGGGGGNVVPSFYQWAMCDRKNSTKTSGKPEQSRDWECNSIFSCWQAYQALAHFGNLIYQWCRLNFGSFNQPLSSPGIIFSPTKILHYGRQKRLSLLKYSFFVEEIFWVTPKYLMFVFEWMCMWEILYIHGATQKTCLDLMI